MRRTGERMLLGAVALLVTAQTSCSAPGAGVGAAGGPGGVGGSIGIGGAGGALTSCLPPGASTGGTRYCSNSKGNASPDYAYELWSNDEGSGCMTVFGVNANFSATWTDTTDFLARAGLRFDRTKTPAQLGTISADFTEAKTESPTAGKTSRIYFAVYGWTISPLAEYYIIDDYGPFVPGPVATDGSPRTHVGTIVVDDGSYDVWHLALKNKPAITGDNKDFDQYYSVRQSRRQCGHVSVSEQFSKWAALGVKLGELEETMFLLEAQGNSGAIDVTATVDIE
jgi:endo-1,4-beta-xylanase